MSKSARSRVKVTDRRTKVDFAQVIRALIDEDDPDAEKIVLVMDNLNPHHRASLYEAFEPAEARRLLDKLERRFAAPSSTAVGSTWPRSN